MSFECAKCFDDLGMISVTCAKKVPDIAYKKVFLNEKNQSSTANSSSTVTHFAV